MTDLSPQTSTLAGAIRIVRIHGLARQVPLVLAMVLTGLLEGIGIASLFPILSIVTQGNSEPTRLNQMIEDALAFLHLPLNLEVLCLLVGVTIWLKAIVGMVVARALGHIGAKIAQEIRQRLLQALVGAKWAYFTIQPVGRFVAAATTESGWASTAFRNSLQVIEQSIRTAIFCGLALFMGWKMAAVAITMGVLMGLSLRTLTRAAHLAGRERQRAMRSMVVELNDVLAGFKPLKAMHRHAGLIGELIKDAKRLRKAVNGLVVTETLSIGLPDLIQTYLLAAGAYLAARVLGSPIDLVIVAGVISFAVMTNISRVRKAMTQLAQSDASYWTLLSTVAEVEKATERFEGTRPPTLAVGCELQNVSFSYGRGPVLTDVTLEIPAGRITTLIGESGSGKTTIADLLLGLYAPDNGTVTVDGVDLRDIDITRWRSLIGYVPQEIILFNDTIMANVSLGDQEIDENRVRAALEAAGLGALLAELPEGLQTPIGERGFKLSGGQRQRIALARALVHEPKLLILDEATSALDPTTEAEICATVAAQAGRMTVLAITHQPSWVERADRIYLVESGRVRAVERASLHRGIRAAN
ncbi:ABC transporter ATP-binding protein [Dongia deserti]|uniref:ABC transporter ATP-binding protein n=1 Tax=Dongia deserti TaxID=2268030 RepID=UPI0013C4495A|nr:ABC transporter ATP-binding protein [Dongia deserti]